MSNTSSGTIVLSEDDNTVVTQAKYSSSDFTTKKSITYKNPESWFDMIKLGTNQSPTPVTIQSNQIPDYGVAVTSVALDKESITLAKNQTATLYATVFPSTAANKSVIWTSESPAVAEVNQSGVITAKSNGYTTIVARTVDGYFVDTYTVIVNSIDVTGISLDKTRVTLKREKH